MINVTCLDMFIVIKYPKMFILVCGIITMMVNKKKNSHVKLAKLTNCISVMCYLNHPMLTSKPLSTVHPFTIYF